MQRLMREDRGAVLVWVALMSVVIFGFGALAVDAAALYQERRELQNGADAAAFAVAQDCASGDNISACNGTYGDWDVTAELYADDNAEDDASDVDVQVDWGAQRVTAVASTIDGATNAGHMTLFFARAFGVKAGAARARAVVIWGNPQIGSMNTLPITVSQCEYDAAVIDQGGLVEDPPPPSDVAERVLIFHNAGATSSVETETTTVATASFGEAKPADPGNGGGNGGGNDSDCPTGPAGHDATLEGELPGGFGWLAQKNGECSAEVSGDTAGEDPGNNVPNECQDDLDTLVGTTVYLPIFVAVNGLGGANGEYTLAGYAGFYVSGYKFPGHSEPDGVTCDSPDGSSSPSNTCLRGWFTTGVLAEGQIAENGGTNYGVKIIALDE